MLRPHSKRIIPLNVTNKGKRMQSESNFNSKNQIIPSYGPPKNKNFRPFAVYTQNQRHAWPEIYVIRSAKNATIATLR